MFLFIYWIYRRWTVDRLRETGNRLIIKRNSFLQNQDKVRGSVTYL